jgi:cytochrome c
MAGPVYHAARHTNSPSRWPDRFDGAVVLWDWERSRLLAAWLDDADRLQRLECVAEDQTFRRPIAARFGPDGALYVVEWGSKWWDNTDAALVRVTGR